MVVGNGPITSAFVSAWGTRKPLWPWLIASWSLSLICGSDQQSYRELGPERAQEQELEASKRRAVRRLEQLGFQVTLHSDEVA
jgi:hypothetical protein